MTMDRGVFSGNLNCVDVDGALGCRAAVVYGEESVPIADRSRGYVAVSGKTVW